MVFVSQHRNVVTAAKDAGVGLVVYTSIANADTSSLGLAAEHQATEQEIAAAGLPYVFLRNSWYLDNYTGQLTAYLEHGIVGASGEGKVSAAARGDFAEAAAVVLTTEGHANQVYELGGAPFTMAELAAELSRQSGKHIVYTDLPVEQYTKVLMEGGVPEPSAAMIADGDRAVARGELYATGNDLERLIGHPPTSLPAAIRAASPPLSRIAQEFGPNDAEFDQRLIALRNSVLLRATAEERCESAATSGDRDGWRTGNDEGTRTLCGVAVMVMLLPCFVVCTRAIC